MKERKKRVVLTGGGTGGHVYPCLAILQILQKHHTISDVLYLGVKGRAEEKIVPRHGITLEFIKSAPVAGLSAAGKLKALAVITAGVRQVILKLLKFKPDLVVGTGGYTSAPVIFGAFLLKFFLRKKITIILEEQNLIPGMLNKVSSLLADAVLLNYKSSSYFVWSKHCIHVGYPVRDEYAAAPEKKSKLKKQLGVPEKDFLILVTGGSLGSRSINRLIASTIKSLSEISNIHIVHSMGMAETPDYHAMDDTRQILAAKMGSRFNPERFCAEKSDGNLFYQGFQYLHNISEWQGAADLIISRAGAGALAEITFMGKASIIIPKRGLPGDHQELNAIEIAEQDGCVLLFEFQDRETGIDSLDPQEFLTTLKYLINNPDRLRSLGKNSAALFYPDFSEKIFRSIENAMEKRKLDLLIHADPPRFVRLQLLFDNLIAHLDTLTKELTQADLEENLYYKFYNKKFIDFLASSNYLVKNKGIKLIGSLRKTEYYPYLVDHFPEFQGYLRRNILTCFRKAETCDPVFASAVKMGLHDSYYETRREAIALFIKFFEELDNVEEMSDRILKLMKKRFESFEVKMQAIQAAVLILDADEFFRVTKRFLRSRNVRLRQALLDAVRLGLKKNRFTDRARVAGFLKEMLISTSDFAPQFKIKRDYNRVIEKLQVSAGGRTND